MAQVPNIEITYLNTHPLTPYLAYYKFQKREYTIQVYTIVRQKLRNHIELHSQRTIPDNFHAKLFIKNLPENYKIIIRKLQNITTEKVIELSKLIETNNIFGAEQLCIEYNIQNTILNWNNNLF